MNKENSEKNAALNDIKSAIGGIVAANDKVTYLSVAKKTGIEQRVIKQLWPDLTAKTERINLRCSIIDKIAFQKKARRANISLTNLFVQSLTRATIIVAPRDLLHKHTVNRNRINANLNMLAKWANIYCEKADATLILAKLIGVERSIKEGDSDVEKLYEDRGPQL